ncbi:hypothetical protein [Thalassotalea hakodatensis]|uniref:hypothetical protein n=1 Tax=Thalassotalea hakodatensis TaxID=3030492 RepID=UPI0025724005|nr:hypothetical protein [Thalassotalea hakodatensis]
MAKSLRLRLLLFSFLTTLSSNCLAINNKSEQSTTTTTSTKKTLTFAVPESLRLEVKKHAYCLMNKTFENMGYLLKEIEHPIMRAFTETRNGNMALALIGLPNFKTTVKPKTSSQGLALTSTPFVTVPISFYSRKDINIEMNSPNWRANYRIGLVRNIYTHDVKKFTVEGRENYHFYINSLSAFRPYSKIELISSLHQSLTTYLLASI